MRRGKNLGRTRGTPQRDWRLIPSVSRSSGLESDGDALTKSNVQEDYFRVISLKLEAYRLQSQPLTMRKKLEENLLIMFRKLREGLLASKRCDSFASEVYETSAYLAIIAANGRHHALPILTYLIFEFDRIKPPNTYLDAASRPLKKTANSDAVLAYLLEILSSNHPSQSEFLSAFQEARSNQRISAAAEVFLQHLATALRRIDTVLLRRLLRPRLSAVDPPFDTGSHPANPNSLIGDVFKVLLDRIRLQARNSVWLCIRTAYRELSVNASGEWLVQSLLLEDAAPDAVASANRWLQARAESGEAQETSLDGERIPGRWSFRRPSN